MEMVFWNITCFIVLVASLLPSIFFKHRISPRTTARHLGEEGLKSINDFGQFHSVGIAQVVSPPNTQISCHDLHVALVLYTRSSSPRGAHLVRGLSRNGTCVLRASPRQDMQFERALRLEFMRDLSLS